MIYPISYKVLALFRMNMPPPKKDAKKVVDMDAFQLLLKSTPQFVIRGPPYSDIPTPKS